MNELMKQGQKVNAILSDIVENPQSLSKEGLDKVIEAVEDLSKDMSKMLAEIKERRNSKLHTN